MLSLEVNDRVYFIRDPEIPEEMRYGRVVEVIRWTSGRTGFTWRVKYDDDGSEGEFRSDSDRKHLFKSSKPERIQRLAEQLLAEIKDAMECIAEPATKRRRT